LLNKTSHYLFNSENDANLSIADAIWKPWVSVKVNWISSTSVVIRMLRTSEVA